MFPCKCGIPLPIGTFQLQNRELARNIPEAEKAGNRLRKHSSPRGSGNSHAKIQDEKKVQTDIQKRSDHQKDQRRNAVTKRTDDAGYHVVKHRRPDSVIDDQHVSQSIIENIGRRIHCNKERPRSQNA